MHMLIKMMCVLLFFFLKNCSPIFDEDEQRKILSFLKNVKVWSDFVLCVKEVDTRTKLTLAYEKSVEEQPFTHVRDIEKW